MINQNIKTQVQNRINAVDNNTALRDLLLLQRSAQGLSCDETNLRSQITARLNELNGASPVIDLVMASKATGLGDDTVLYSAPFAVSAGDDIFIDVLGKLKKKQHPISMATKIGGITSLVGTSSVYKTYLNTMRGGRYDNQNEPESFCFTLQDGNLMVGFPGQGAGAGGLYHVFVLSSTDLSVLSFQSVNITYGSQSSSYFRGVGLREISANVFRYYFVAAPSGELNSTVVTFNTITYNPTTKAVTSGTGATIQVSPAGSFGAEDCIQGSRYVLLSTSSSTYCLDMQNGTVSTYAGISGVVALNQALQFDVDNVGNEYALVLAGSTPKLLKAGVDSVIDIPANLASDGCFGSSWIKTRIGAGAYLTRNIGAKTIKLVKFNSSYTSCTIHTLSNNYDSISSSSVGQAVFKRGTTYFFAPNSSVKSVVAFEWDGENPPSDFRASNNVDAWDMRHLGNRGRSLASSVETLVNIGCFAASNNGTTIEYGAFVQFCDTAELFTTRATKIGTALTNAQSGNLFELRLNKETTFISSNDTTDLSRIKHSGLITKLDKCRPHKLKAMQSSGASLSYSTVFDAIEYGEIENSSGVDTVSFGSGALVVTEADVQTTWRVDATVNVGGISLYQLNGSKRSSASSSAIVVGRVNAPKPVVVATYASTLLTSETPL